MRENFKAALTEEIIEENPGVTSVIEKKNLMIFIFLKKVKH